MNRRNQGNGRRRSVALLFYLTFSLLTLRPGARGATQARGWWVVRHLLADSVAIQELVHRAKEHHFNMLFVQVRGRGDSYYDLDIEPRAGRLKGAQFDPLDITLRYAHQYGIEVHAWLNVFLVGDQTRQPAAASHIIAQHPQWVMATADGRSLLEFSEHDFKKYQLEGIYLSPGIPEARDHFTRLVTGILEHYPVDGIHLDYIRYPDLRTDYNPLVLKRFKEHNGFSPKQHLKAEQTRQWLAWRQEQVTGWVRAVHQVIETKRPGTILSAAVKPNYSLAGRDYGQDWPSWVEQGIIDLVIPMVYDPGNEQFRDKVAVARQLVDPQRLYIGISIYNQPAFSAIQKLYSLALQPEIPGVVLFSYNWVRQDPLYQEQIGVGPFQETAGIPVRQWKTPGSK